MRIAIACIAGLLALTAAPASAASTVVLGEGTGGAAFTFCPYNDMVFTLDAVNAGGTWTAHVTLTNPYLPCVRGIPALTFTGSWDPSAGGCGLHSADLQLCFAAATPGQAVHWGMCQLREPVCDSDYEVLRGSATLAFA